MMEPLSLDPYEQQLLKVFDSYDHDNRGSLDKHGLMQLCQSLQLEEQSTDLIKCLLKDPKCSRATFPEFKEALLTLLGSMQNNKTHQGDDTPKKEIDKGSPDREVSPKFVYGSKKYGRRSRPRADDINSMIGEQNDMNSINKSPGNVSVQRSNSQSEVSNSKKRKTNYKLKRCTSLPGYNDFAGNQKNLENSFVTSHALSSEPEFVCTEDMLKEAWEKLGVGKDGYLNQTELILVCDAIGLQKLAKGVIRQLSSKLTLDYDHKISFQELLEALQQDDTWSEVLSTTPTNNLEETLSSESLFPDSRMVQHVSLGPDGNGTISTDIVVEMWENAGITSPKELLQELGFNSRQINIADLAAILEKEMKGIAESRRLENNPHVVLLQATLTLYQSEIRCLKNILEQMHAEREKLKYDVLEANNRATLLAQEVDDNHIRMEQNTQNQVKLIEQRHNDILKEVMQQFASEKEQMAMVNQSLEQKIRCLEQETEKLKNDIHNAQKYASSIEKENQALSGQIHELQQAKDTLTKQIEALENDKQKFSEMEQEQMEPLLSKLSSLQVENTQLRDRIDEMVAEIESLTNQVASMRSRVSSTPTFNTLDQSMEDNVSIICEGVGIGSKRRSDYSPSKDVNLFGITDGSPRLGKVRKFHCSKGENFDVVPFTSSESGFDTEVDCFDSSLSTNEPDEIKRLQAKIAFLEQVLTQHAIPIPTSSELEGASSTPSTISYLSQRVQELEGTLRETKGELTTMLDQRCLNCDTVTYINTKLDQALLHGCKDDLEEPFSSSCDVTVAEKRLLVDVATETDQEYTSLEDKIKFYEDENRELGSKCGDLENCVELLRNEYERCEDYWANKLDEERQLFVQEQTQSNEKVAELLGKIAEYEEHLLSRDSVDSRLPTIQETYNLEKQFTDLEKEFEEYKLASEAQVSLKDEEISRLTQQLNDLSVHVKTVDSTKDAVVQVDDLAEYVRITSKMKHLSNHLAECTNLFSGDTMPISWESQEMSDTSCTTPAPNFVWNKEANMDEISEPSLMGSTSYSLPTTWSSKRHHEVPSQPLSLSNIGSSSSSVASTVDKNNAPCRPKRTRKHEKNMSLYRKNSHGQGQEKDVRKNEGRSWRGAEERSRGFGGEQAVMVPLATMHNLNGRLHQLEQRCRHLQLMLKQQHYYAEQNLQYCWQQHKGEKAELQYLLKSNQDRLDQQIRICNDQLDKLTKSDMLVKELYVENSYLIATVQRLQQRCDMLAQCNVNSSV